MSTAVLTEPLRAKPKSLPAPPPLIELRGVRKGFGHGAARTEVLGEIDLRLREGEFLAVCGFSGSGKTTLVKLIAGLLQADAGDLLMQGRPITGPGSDRGVVFQNYSLLPWLTVRGNIALGVDRILAGRPRSERRERVDHFIELVGLTHAADRRPAELSGGMRQRVSLARALAMKPQVLLLDEPLSALDAMTRSVMQEEILRIWEEERQTCLMITNDVDEAILVADRIVPLNPGPAAVMGPSFAVDLPRPRDKTSLNHDPNFKGLRNAVTNYLIAVRDKARTSDVSLSDPQFNQLPDLAPQLTRLPSRAILNSPV